MTDAQWLAIGGYEDDLRGMSDIEIRREIAQVSNAVAEEESWLEALTSEETRRRGSPEQQMVNNWVTVCLGKESLMDRRKRAFRFVEEALELAQACEVSVDDVNTLRDYVFGRPVGEVAQEISGVTVTLMALATSQGVDVLEVLRAEINRVSDPVILAKIRAKAAAAPEGPLPQ